MTERSRLAERATTWDSVCACSGVSEAGVLAPGSSGVNSDDVPCSARSARAPVAEVAGATTDTRSDMAVDCAAEAFPLDVADGFAAAPTHGAGCATLPGRPAGITCGCAPGVMTSSVVTPSTLLADTPGPARQATLPRKAASAASASNAVREPVAPLTVSVTRRDTACGLELGDAPGA